MEVVNAVVLFLLGFFILIRGAQILVKGATSVAKLFNISTWFIGIAVVGIGTSIPELSINLVSAFEGSSVGLGTIIGSNTFNLLMILGVSALFTPIVMQGTWIKDFAFNVLAVAIAGVVILLPVLGDGDFLGVTHFEGALLLALFVGWLVVMFRRGASEKNDVDYQVFGFVTSLVMIVAGVFGVFFGGAWVVDGAEQVATFLGVSPAVIALTIVGAGTSLPELTVSVVAALRKNMSIAVGNVIGSNIFDFLGILGITALVHPIAIEAGVRFDIFATFLATALLFAFLFIGKHLTLGRIEGIVFILSYVAYVLFFFWRG